jgi:hypothetical protein
MNSAWSETWWLLPLSPPLRPRPVGCSATPEPGGFRLPGCAVAAGAQLLAPAVLGSPAVCLAWNAAIRSAMSSAWVASAKWPVSSR